MYVWLSIKRIVWTGKANKEIDFRSGMGNSNVIDPQESVYELDRIVEKEFNVLIYFNATMLGFTS